MEEAQEQSIRRMSDTLASQVAAGEVVERPASVVKELVENSIDAGAHAVRVEIRRGGISLIRVTDDGSGMSPADAEMCLQRHATSKLLTVQDLFDIRHLGFRGEALPSIASVSQMSITTRRAKDVEGRRILCNGGETEPAQSAGCAPGTDISIANLFYNTPVRRKFLKSEETESGHVEHQVKLHALAYPEVRFTFVRDGQTVFDLSATTDLRRRIAGFIGQQEAETLMRIRPTEAPGVRVTGFLMPLSAARRNRKMQFFFLNGRPIEDSFVTRAVRDGYGGFPTGLHPALFLYLEVEPALVDVNVHPAKREVRFRRPAEITMAVMDAVAGTLAQHARGENECETPAPQEEAPPASTAPTPAASAAPPPAAPAPEKKPLVLRPLLQPVLAPQQKELHLPPSEPKHKEESAPAAQREPHTAPRPISPVPSPAPQEAPAPTAETDPALPHFRFLGMLHGRYALFENAEGMVMMSPRAARERIIFERLAATNKQPLISQRLLVPELIELDARDMGIAMEVKPQLERAGYAVSVFGRNTLRVEAVPAILPLKQAAPFLSELLGVFTSGGVRLNRARNPFEPFALQLAHRYAAQEDLAPWLASPLSLLADLLRCEIPYCTPNGRPTLLPFPLTEIERRFAAR
ncbi:MAG: DNA mismatch repair endonuclease MutL [Akkermansia sp.]|nr:DNA mismatch repair endonuclease MutL [Akkermansia sp.]